MEAVLERIDAAILERNLPRHRWYLGGSEIGHHCQRYLFYNFRWCKAPEFPARIHRIFDRGHREEIRVYNWLANAGYTVRAWDENHEQFSFRSCGGHFSGHCDGFISGPDLPDGEGLLEIKTSNDRSFKQMQKDGVKECKIQHWAQMQIYMKHFDKKWCLYFCVNKNDDDIHMEIVKRSAKAAKALEDMASKIIFTEDAPRRISDNPSWYQCKMCLFNGICHGEEIPAVTCRTCARVTPVQGEDQDDRWKCSLDGKSCGKDCESCDSHIFHPAVLNAEPLDMNNERIVWKFSDREIENGKQYINSIDMWEGQ